MKHLKITTLYKSWHDKDEKLRHAVFQWHADSVEQHRAGSFG